MKIRKHTVLAPAFALVALSVSAAVPFKLGIAGYTYCRKSLDQALSSMSKMDVHYLCIKDALLDYKLGADAPIAAYKEKCSASGVESLAAGPLYYSDEPQARKLFEFAKAYGIGTVVVVPFGKREIGGKSERVETEESLDILEKLVKEFDIRAAIHNHGPDIPYLYPTAESVWKRIKDRDPRIGFCLDVGHQRRAGGDPAEAIRKYAGRIYDIHLKNIKIDPVKNIAMPGPSGELDIRSIFAALADIGYKGVCHIEYERDFEDNDIGVALSVGYYRGVIDSLK